MKGGVVPTIVPTLTNIDGATVVRATEDLFKAVFNKAVAVEPAANGHMSPADHVRAAMADVDAQRDELNKKFYALVDALHLLDPADPNGEPF